MVSQREKHFLLLAVEEAAKGMNGGHGGPFGCIIVQGDTVIAGGHNAVTSTNDPTAHAEVVAIREACQKLGSFQLTGCEIYCSCEPCPMCFGAIYWARPDKVYYANNRHDAADIGFDDQFIYDELNKPNSACKIPMVEVDMPEAKAVFASWQIKKDKVEY